MKKILLAFLLGLNLAIISGCGDAKKDTPAPATGGDPAKPAEPATK